VRVKEKKMLIYKILSAIAVAGTGIVALKLLKHKMLKMKTKNKKCAVILSGCGYLDGSETTESIAVLCSLSEFGIDAVVFAPDDVAPVVDHQSGKSLGYAPRHMMQESARLSRGDVHSLNELKASEFDALVIPGGFGAAKNLCDWATAASPSDCKVNEFVKRALIEFSDAKKPIGLCCIAPVLAAVCIPGVKLTVGKPEPSENWPYGGTCGQVASLGATNVPCEVCEVCVDKEKKIVTTPAYMCAAPKHEVFFGVRKMIKNLAWLL
jgi:enhancing lycopene biosynthesis protein 2